MVKTVKRLIFWLTGIAGTFSTFLMSTVAMAETKGIAKDWQLGMQSPAGPLAEQGHDFWMLLLYICIIISVFVLVLMLVAMIRFRAKANPTPSPTTHNTVLEMVWTIVPVIILVVIFVPSMRFLYYQNEAADADLTVKAVGHQWYWSYEYPDQGFEFSSFMVEEADLAPGEPRLLEVDAAVVVPVDAKVRILTTSTDVIHSWAVPAFFVKMDAVPGRLNETWFKAEEEGVYYGQCSELCGINHGYMPIKVEVVSQQEFDSWVADTKEQFAAAEPTESVRVAVAGTGASR